MGYEVDVLEEKGMQEVQISGEINFFSMSVKVLDFLPKVDMIFTEFNANIHIPTTSRLVLGVLGVAGVLGYFCLTRSLQASICHILRQMEPPPHKHKKTPFLGTAWVGNFYSTIYIM